MSRLARAIQILKAINEHFQADAVELYADARIMDSDLSIKDEIAACIGTEEVAGPPIIPHSRRRKVVHWRGEISGWIGKRKVEKFGTDQEAAYKWLHELD